MKSKIIITGAKGLIGKKIFQYLKSKGHHLVGIDLKDGDDLSNSLEVKKLMNEYKNFEYLINLHGFNDHVDKSKKSVIKLDEKEIFDKYFHSNVYSNYLTNLHFIKCMKKPKGIINFASQYAVQSPKHYIYDKPKNVFYVASKFSVIGLTKYFATFFGKKLNVNCIINSGIEFNQPKEFKKKLISHIPKNRMMKIEDLYGVIELLVSKKSQYMNGSLIYLDGGYSSW